MWHFQSHTRQTIGPQMFIRLKRKIRNAIAKTEFYPFVAKFLKQPFISNLNDADLILESPPRSGNSYAEAVLRLAFPNIRLVHHTHASGVVIWGTKHNIPSIILIRDPDENAVSALLERPDLYDWKLAFSEWNDFYLSCEKYRSHITICPFTKLVSDPMHLVKQAENILGRAAQFTHFDEDRSAMAMKLVDQLAQERVDIDHTNYSPFVSEMEKEKRKARKEHLVCRLSVSVLPERTQAKHLFSQWTEGRN